MNERIIHFTSITQKLTMGLAGFFLMSFLLVHLAVNLLMLCNDNGLTFSLAVEFMTTNILIKVFEYVLFTAFIVHILLGIFLKLKNKTARPINYSICTKSESSFFSRYMIWTGLLVLIFLILHFFHFYFVKIGLVAKPEVADNVHDFYPMAKVLFQNNFYFTVYVVLISVLGLHLYHAFQSFFQTLGFPQGQFFKVIKIIGLIYSLIISVGFNLIPIYFMFFYN